MKPMAEGDLQAALAANRRNLELLAQESRLLRRLLLMREPNPPAPKPLIPASVAQLRSAEAARPSSPASN